MMEATEARKGNDLASLWSLDGPVIGRVLPEGEMNAIEPAKLGPAVAD